MPHYFGITLALVALISWGFGDFFIQKTTRIVGIWKALFYIGFLGLVVLFPFVKNEILTLDPKQIMLLALLCLVVVFAALFDFKALKQGKMAIVEPLIGLELPITVALSITVGQEHIRPVQLILIALTFVGIVMAVTIHHTHLHYHKRIFEKGVIIAGLGAIGLALTNFLIGVSSQEISPLLTIWITHSLVAVVCAIYLISTKEFKNLWPNLKANPKPIIGQSVLDNVAWISFAYSTTYIPIAVATTLSESYIALAVVLGIFLNREKLKPHQILGVVLAIGSVIALSIFTSAK